MTGLKLLALDEDDLAIVSTYTQDSVFKVTDLAYEPSGRQFSLEANRFVWERPETGKEPNERRRALLVFKRVENVRSQGFNRADREKVLSLLALRFTKNGDGPEGTLELTLSGGGGIALDVECIEVLLADIGGAWETATRPRHPGEDRSDPAKG